MRYLKKFESFTDELKEPWQYWRQDVQDHLDEIKSVFQEYIDQYDMEELPDDLEEDDDSVSGLFYHLYWYGIDKKRGLVHFQFDFYIYDNASGDFFEKCKDFLKNKYDIELSLKSRGYEVSSREDYKTLDDDYPQCDYSFKINWKFQ